MLKELFSPAPNMKPGELRDYMASHQVGSYTLLDVRQPGEYQKRHIPGAKLIPIGELNQRLDELDPEKPTIAY